MSEKTCFCESLSSEQAFFVNTEHGWESYVLDSVAENGKNLWSISFYSSFVVADQFQCLEVYFHFNIFPVDVESIKCIAWYNESYFYQLFTYECIEHNL